MSTPPKSSRELWWDARTAWPMTVLSVVFLGVYSLAILWESAPRDAVIGLRVSMIVIWVVFLADYVVRAVLSARPLTFVATHKVDALTVIVPFLRPLRILQYLQNLSYFRQASGAAVRTRILIVAGGYAILFVWMIALLELNVERHAPGATITSIGDALWWASVTITTVGYGDTYPVTPLGRVLAIVLMAGGLAIVGTVTGTIISYIGERIKLPGVSTTKSTDQN
ncbi:potassium channel family protein [Subtercola sp. PAMC28395]|uniref:potassium channel family protein n=1 Tax=Subtercola sp. PAMC28395 TaxID=2846775 RepID=UPI001C0BC36D|nr:potassium channel family protein [Subtercola sp. PAMC28395]QWT24401.1 potassium channel family protein [Subtercola sp. PAMC28395]